MKSLFFLLVLLLGARTYAMLDEDFGENDYNKVFSYSQTLWNKVNLEYNAQIPEDITSIIYLNEGLPNLFEAQLDGTNFSPEEEENRNKFGGQFLALAGINLQHAALYQANFDNADLRYANLKDAFMNSSSFKNVNFEGANLKQAQLLDAHLNGANFTNANLERANLSRANIKGANFERANLKGANIKGVFPDIFLTKFDDNTCFTNALCDEHTHLPGSYVCAKDVRDNIYRVMLPATH